MAWELYPPDILYVIFHTSYDNELMICMLTDLLFIPDGDYTVISSAELKAGLPM